jgi:hypothetical protein
MVVAGKRRVHYIIGVATGVRGWGPKRGPCTVHGGAVGLYHSSFGCDLTPDPEEAGQRIAGVVIAIVGPPSLPYHRVEFPSHFYQDWYKRDWDWGVSKPKLAGQNSGKRVLHSVLGIVLFREVKE